MPACSKIEVGRSGVWQPDHMSSGRLCKMPCSAREPKGKPEQPGPEVDPDGVEAEQGTDDGQAAQLEYEVGDVQGEHGPDPDDLLPQRQRLLVGQEVADASFAHHYHRHPNAEQLDV